MTAAVVLALVMAWFDSTPEWHPDILPQEMRDAEAAGARSVLSVIATSIIGVTGVMFSVTIVAVTFASGKYGPRLIDNFMRDRGNQWSLGILIATFTYALIVLREVQGSVGTEDYFVPQYSLLAAIILALLAVATMIYFFHHIPEAVNVSIISAGLGQRFCAAVRAHDLPLPEAGDDLPKPPARTAPRVDLLANETGYIQTVDVGGIVEVAERTGVHVTLTHGPGGFVAQGDPVFELRGPSIDHDDQDALRTAIAMGNGPTEAQNSRFIADKLVEMVARALSPGVNDPFTAINCLNWLYAGLSSRLREPPEQQSHPLVTVPETDFAALLAASFGASADYITTDSLVRAHARDLLTRLHSHASGTDAAAITKLIKMFKAEN